MTPLEPRREARLRRLVAAARQIADPHHPLGQRARELLPAATGLSPAGVELALAESLETQPSGEELRELAAGVPRVSRAHVLLASNVFVAAHRAIALGIAASDEVFVRPSRREPHFTELLCDGSRGLFKITEELVPRPGEQLWAYGSDETLESLRAELPAGVVLHGHGAGFGVAVWEPGVLPVEQAARGLALDVCLFDQQGCLSPRWVLVPGTAEQTRELGRALAHELSAFEARVPRGLLPPEVAAQAARYRDTVAYCAELCFAGRGVVGVDVEGRLLLPPPGRHVHVVRVSNPLPVLEQNRAVITALGLGVSARLGAALRRSLPGARVSLLGGMQKPRFDGPVDRRVPPAGVAL